MRKTSAFLNTSAFKDYSEDLLLTFLLVPVIRWCLDQCSAIYLGTLFAFWLIAVGALGIEVPIFFSLNVLMFFSVGAYLAHSPKHSLYTLFHRNPLLAWVSVIGFLILLAARAWTFLLIDKGAYPLVDKIVYSEAYLSILRVFGVLAFAQFIIAIAQTCRKVFNCLIQLSQYAFFIFAVHYPLIEIIKVVAGKLPGQDSAVGAFLSWLLIPIGVTITCIIAAWVLNKLVPPLFSLMNGKRSLTFTNSNKSSE